MIAVLAKTIHLHPFSHPKTYQLETLCSHLVPFSHAVYASNDSERGAELDRLCPVCAVLFEMYLERGPRKYRWAGNPASGERVETANAAPLSRSAWIRFVVYDKQANALLTAEGERREARRIALTERVE